MERIGWKGLPQLVYFSFTCLRSDNRVFPSSWDIIFLSFFLHFWNQLFGLINLLKNLFFISFEALSKQHVWNFWWLGRGWMRWQGPTRELTWFDLVLGHQVCLGLLQLLMTWRKWYGLQKLTKCESTDRPQGTKCVWLAPFMMKRVRQIKGSSKISLIWGPGLMHKLCLICLNYGKAWSGWKRWGHQKLPLAWPWLVIWMVIWSNYLVWILEKKVGQLYEKVGQGLGWE